MTRALILRLSALGDVIHTIPAVVALRDVMPQTTIEWLVEQPYAPLVEIVANVRAIPVSLKRWGRAPLRNRDAIRHAFRSIRGTTIAIDFQGLLKSATIGRLSGATERHGFDRSAIREKAAGFFLNRRAAVDHGRHVIDWNLDLARSVAPSVVADPPRVDFAPFVDDPSGKLKTFDGSVVFLPGAGKPNKQWPPERFRELARLMRTERIVVAWGPGERELAEAIGEPLAPATNLRELAYLLQRAKLVIGGDTGPLHLAVALGTPVIGMYGPTNFVRNGPYGQISHCVETFTTSRSMQEVAVHAVRQKVAEVLGA